MSEFKLKQTAEEVQKAIDDASTPSDWNQTDSSAADFIKNKPFGEGYGDTLTIEAIDLDTFDPSTLVGERFLKVCDTVVTMDDLSNGYVFQLLNEVAEVPPEAVGETAMQIADGICTFGEAFISIEEQGVGVEVDGMVFPESGIYMMADLLSEMGGSLTIPGYTGFPVTKKIEEKYLPNNHTRFYYVGDDYLYSDLGVSKVTVEELKTAARKGLIIVQIGANSSMACSPLDINILTNDVIEYGALTIWHDEFITLYTAEYTAS